MKFDKLFEVTIGILVTISLGLGMWGLKSLVDHETASAADTARLTAQIEALRADVSDLKGGPTRNEWNDLKLQIGGMNDKLDRLLQRDHR